MKTTAFILVFCGLTSLVQAQVDSVKQTASVEKSLFGIQTGLFGVWINSEMRLSDPLALRIEVGLSGVMFNSNTRNKEASFSMIPVVAVEPRWYYNLNRRMSKAKDISGNSSDFAALKIFYRPEWSLVPGETNSTSSGGCVLLDDSETMVLSTISIAPIWGIKRNLGKHFNYEIAGGVEFAYVLSREISSEKNPIITSLQLHLRIGYKF